MVGAERSWKKTPSDDHERQPTGFRAKAGRSPPVQKPGFGITRCGALTKNRNRVSNSRRDARRGWGTKPGFGITRCIHSPRIETGFRSRSAAHSAAGERNLVWVFGKGRCSVSPNQVSGLETRFRANVGCDCQPPAAPRSGVPPAALARSSAFLLKLEAYCGTLFRANLVRSSSVLPNRRGPHSSCSLRCHFTRGPARVH